MELPSTLLLFGKAKILIILTTVLLALLDAHVAESLRIEVWAEGQNQSNVQIRKATYNITLEARQVQLFCKLILHPGDSPVASLAWELQQSRGAKVLVKSSRATDQTVISTPLAVTTSQIVRVAQCIVRTPPKYFEAEWYTVTVQALGGPTPWSQWSKCEVGCGLHSVRTRKCFNPWNQKPTAICPGPTYNSQNRVCPANGCVVTVPNQGFTTDKPRVPSHIAEESNLRIIVACSSGLIGSLLLAAVLACWRRLHLEQVEHRRQLLQPEATEPRYHGLSEESSLRAAPPPTYHDTFDIDVSRVTEMDAMRSISTPLPSATPTWSAGPPVRASDASGEPVEDAGGDVSSAAEEVQERPDTISSILSGAIASASSVPADDVSGQQSHSAPASSSPTTAEREALLSPGNQSLLATPSSPAGGSPSLNNSSEPVNIAERSTLTYNYMVHSLKYGITDDEKPIEEWHEDWSTNEDTSLLHTPS